MPKLTKKVVDAAAADPARKLMVWDGELRGFGLRVTPAGVKSYVVAYRTAEGRQREFTIGKHGSPWTCDQARDRAREVLRAVADGVDPLAEKSAARSAMTVAQLADLYLAEGPAEKPNKKPRSWETDGALLKAHVRPLLGSRTVKGLTRADIGRFQMDVAEGKSARKTEAKRGRRRVIGGKGVAARATATLKAMLSFATSRKIIADNPSSGVQLLKQEKVERFLSEKEVAKLAEVITGLEDETIIAPAYAGIFRMLMLTGCRVGEMESLQWDWIDAERGLIRFPDSKTGAKVTPLPSPAAEILTLFPRRVGDPYVFPGTRGRWGRISALPKAWDEVRAAAGMPELRLHDLRHSFASFAVADGASLYLVGKVLGHKQASTTEIYAHLRDDPLKAVADATAQRIAAAMRGKRA
ncbi:tyrosine-type recombinase/integrase [Xanthobacter autotrophicus DSM 597]|uniref:tyrosine-type recombinase/integrase n=1 Tax=Xanthobacter wiegelii TaxID=3119913 RepID=UPI00372739EA